MNLNEQHKSNGADEAEHRGIYSPDYDQINEPATSEELQSENNRLRAVIVALQAENKTLRDTAKHLARMLNGK